VAQREHQGGRGRHRDRRRSDDPARPTARGGDDRATAVGRRHRRATVHARRTAAVPAVAAAVVVAAGATESARAAVVTRAAKSACGAGAASSAHSRSALPNRSTTSTRSWQRSQCSSATPSRRDRSGIGLAVEPGQQLLFGRVHHRESVSSWIVRG